MFFRAFVLLVSVLGIHSVNAETETLDLVTERGCFICHSMHDADSDVKPLAPSYPEIAARYQDRGDAQSYLINRIIHGTAYSEQNWSDSVSMRFMPPNVNVTRLEAAQMSHWILNLEISEELQARLEHHEEMLVLSTTSGCMSCHRIDPTPDSRLMPLAPSFKAIAERYAGDKGAMDELVHSVLRGTRAASKKWENVNMQFMPPSVALSKESAASLVDWILKLN